jgi:two-component system sensor histidine kinase/response regulator
MKVARRTQALRQSQEILQKREAFFRAIFDNAAVGIVSLDPRAARPGQPAFARFVDQPIDTIARASGCHRPAAAIGPA